MQDINLRRVLWRGRPTGVLGSLRFYKGFINARRLNDVISNGSESNNGIQPPVRRPCSLE